MLKVIRNKSTSEKRQSLINIELHCFVLKDNAGSLEGSTTYAWNNVILPRQNGPSGYEQYYSYDIQHLLVDSRYEAQVQAKNKFGWSDRSDSLVFATMLRQKPGKTS